MWKISVLLTAVLFVLPCFASANADMNKVKKANSFCPGIDSSNNKTARKAVKKCDNKGVLEAVLYYHEDFGSRYYAAKKISDKEILKKAYRLAKSEKISDKNQVKIRDNHLLKLIRSKIKKKPEKPVSIQSITKMESVGELAELFHKHPSFVTKLYAVKRAYELLSYMPHSSSYVTSELNAKIEGLNKFKKIVSKSIPKIKAMSADSDEQRSYKKKLLAELHKMEKQINPKPGEEVYIDKEAHMRYVNAFRAKHNVQPIVKYDSRLDAAARKWAEHHFKKKLKNLDHGPVINDRKAHSLRIEAEGYFPNESGENLDRPIIPNARGIFVDWRESQDHMENMIDPEHREMGLSCIYAPLPADFGLADYVCVQLFTDGDYK